MAIQPETRKSESYPLYDLQEVVRIAEKIRDLGGGNSPVARSLLAKELHYAESGPSFFQRVAACKAFGLIDGRGSYSLTELSRQYFYPMVDNGQRTAAVKLLSFPKAFSVLVQKFDGGKLPSLETLGNIIHAEAEVPVSRKNALATCFVRSAQFAGVLDAGGYLRCKALIAASGRATGNNDDVANNTPPPLTPPPLTPPPPIPPRGAGYEKSFDLGEEPGIREVILNCPRVISKSEFDRICSWIKVTWIIKEDEVTQ